jgi:CO dehydrogenase/acetyl-CoA synthase gamma subunit (corrinoid Fe-S protein)
MVLIVAHFDVEKVEKAIQVFMEQETLMKAAGSMNSKTLVDLLNETKVTLIVEWNSVENFKKYFGAPELKEMRKNATVIGQPEIHMLKQYEE